MHQRIRVLTIHKVLQTLNVPLVVHNSLTKRGDIIREGSRFCGALCFDFFATLGVRLELGLELLQLREVLVLDLGVLYLDDAQLLLVLLARISESISELIGLLGI